MNSDEERIEELMLRVINREATADELHYFSDWLKIPENAACFEQFKKLWNLTSGPRATPDKTKTELHQFVQFMHEHRNLTSRYRMRKIYRVAAWVAACMLPLMVAVWGWNRWRQQELRTFAPVTNVIPGSSKAVLTLASGEQILLKPGEVAKNSLGTNVELDERNNILHYLNKKPQKTALKYDRLDIPRGGEFTVTLADSTVVYLNSASTLTYPPVFHEKERKVFLSGEAYFEVKKEDSRPFFVVTDAVTIRVYGTAFNVSTRCHGNTQTVLITGCIGISGNQENAPEFRLKPLQMADYSPDGVLNRIVNVDPRSAVAWKEGLFVFEDENLGHIMDLLSLWYDVDVIFQSERVKNYHFTGHMERYEQIDVILKAISKMVGVHFSIANKTIIVSE